MTSRGSLPWLLDPPSDFRQRLAAAQMQDVASLIEIASYALDPEQLRGLGRKIDDSQGANGGLTPLRLGVISSGTSDFLRYPIIATGLRFGFAIEVVLSHFGQAFQEASDAASPVNQAGVDVVLLSLNAAELALHPGLGDPAGCVERAIAQVDATVRSLLGYGATAVVVETIAPPPNGPLGSAEAWTPNSLFSLIEQVNAKMRTAAAEGRYCVLDTAVVAAGVGLFQWHDPILWHHAKVPFAFRHIPLFCDHLIRILAGLRGRSRRCLVLDLDNTLWGGAVGDEGIDRLVLGAGSASGEAYLDIQRTALQLRSSGVLLAVASKNDEARALDVIDRHPEMLIRREHLAAYMINWEDKSRNLEVIAKKLNLALDSFVFLDDNPGERARVRSSLPMVAVPEVGDDPALFSDILLAAGYFERQRLSSEDIARADMYRTEAVRSGVRGEFDSIESYLRSLDMELICVPIGESNLTRATQLINKTNQFNVTTRRRTEAEVRDLSTRADYFTMTARLADKFGSSGLVGIAICQKVTPRHWEIENFLMSCRVLNRGVEEAMMNEVVSAALAEGVETITGIYIPTDRNDMVRSLFERLGFSQESKSASGHTSWTVRPDAFAAQAHYLRIVTA